MLAACGQDESGKDGKLPPGDVRGGDGSSDLSEASDAAGESSQDVRTAPPDEEFVAAFVYKGIVAGENDDQSDLYIVDSHGRNPANPAVEKPVALTTFALNPDDCELVVDKYPDGTPLNKAPCSCHLGCVVDKTLTWILVTVEKPDQNGFAFQIGKFNADLQVQMVKGAVFKNIVDTAFAGKYLYFSKIVFCADPTCQFQVFRFDLDDIPNPQAVFMIPPEDDPDFKDGQTVTDGHFTASPDGNTLAFLSPTIRSTRVYLWREGAVTQLDYICPGGMQGDHCTGTGSEFSDVDPLAFSTDGSKLAYFPTTKDGLELRLYNTTSAFVSQVFLMNTTGKDFKAESCNQIHGNDWKFNKVSAPMFAHNGKSVFFVASSQCDLSKKPLTDVIELSVSAISAGNFTQTSFKNITNNPRTNTMENSVIQAFDLSPEGRNIAFIGSPSFGEDKYTPLPESSAKAKSSAEVWVVPLDSPSSSSSRRQITYNSKFSATWIQTLPPL